jgi:hydrogenase-4 component B
VQPVFDGFSILSPSWLWITMPSLLLIVAAFTRVVSGTRMTRVRRVPAWRSATTGVDGTDCYTASGFANPTRRVLASLLHTRAEIRSLDAGQAETASTPGRPSAAIASGAGAHLGYSSDVIEVVETYLYHPLVRPLMTVVRAARRLQSGRLDAYLAYMLIALIAAIAIVVALA